MLVNAFETRFSELKPGDSFINYDGTEINVVSVFKTKTGRINFYHTSKYQLSPRLFSNGAIKDRFILTLPVY